MAISEGIAGIIAAGISAAAAGASTGVQAGRGKKGRAQAQNMFDQQMAFAREQWDYQKYAAENAYQISVADAENAGLSPLAVLDAGTSGSTSANGVSQPSAYDPSVFSPDMNTFVDGIRGAAEIMQRGLEEEGRNKRNSDDNSTKLQAIQDTYQAESLLLGEKNEHEMSTLLTNLSAASWTQDSSQQHDRNMAVINSFKDVCGFVPRQVEYDNQSDYDNAYILMDAKLQPILEEYSKMTNVSSGSASEGSSFSNAGGADVSAGVGFAKGSIGANGSHSESSSASSSQFQNKSENNKAWLAKKIKEAGITIPIMVSKSPYKK